MKINNNEYKESFKVLAPPLSSSPPLPSSVVVVSPAATVVVVVSGSNVVAVVTESIYKNQRSPSHKEDYNLLFVLTLKDIPTKSL